MKLTLTYPLYRRKDASNKQAPVGYLSDSESIELEDIVIGKPIDGNSVWYKANDNLYYWSGGFDSTDFELPVVNFIKLTDEEKMIILSDALEYYSRICKSIYPEVTGIFIGAKSTNGAIVAENSLVFQVKQKVGNPESLIPSPLRYKGFVIPTDVLEVQIARFEIISPGNTCSRIGVLDVSGSVGVKVKRKEGPRTMFYFLTNYHVAAADLIVERVFNFRFPKALAGRQFMVPAQMSDPQNKNPIGAFHEGLLSQFHDTALILLSNPGNCNNRVKNGNIIQSALDIIKKPSFVGQMATLFGSMTKEASSTIVSVNSSQIFDAAGHEHQMTELIQINKFSQPGDSGSAVLLGNQIIGIHVGSDDQFSYAIPIQRILTFFNLEIA